MLPELFDHPDQNVRASSKGLTLELCRWIGKDPVKSILFEKMRDTMVRYSQNFNMCNPVLSLNKITNILCVYRKRSWKQSWQMCPDLLSQLEK
jgi:hypothetical protein